MKKDLDLTNLVLMGITGGVWNVPSVRDEPELTLRQWQVYEVDGGHRHLVGWCDERGEGRVSSKLVAFDAATRKCRTDSGRVYELAGPPGRNGDADYVWGRWCRINKPNITREVTVEIAQAVADASTG